jgi:hypothetical protein
MRTTDISQTIPLSVADTFSYATNLKHPDHWLVADGQTLKSSAESLGQGVSFRVIRGNGMEFVYDVTEFDPPSTFTVRTEGRILTYTSRRTFREQNGMTQVVDHIQMEPPPGILRSIGWWILRGVRGAHEKSLLKLKEALEGQP